MQKFVSQPRGDGYYEVAKWDEAKKEYIPLPKVVYKMEQKAQERARQLNEENKEQEKQLMKDNSLLPKEEVENELISPSKKNEDGKLLFPKKEKENELLPQSNNTNNDGLIEFDPNTRAELERMKELYKYGRDQNQS